MLQCGALKSGVEPPHSKKDAACAQGRLVRVGRSCSTGHVGRLRRDLGLPAISLGPGVRFKPDHVMAWIEECRDQPERSDRGQT